MQMGAWRTSPSRGQAMNAKMIIDAPGTAPNSCVTASTLLVVFNPLH